MSTFKNLVFKRFNSNLKKTALHDLHVSLGGTMVPYAGYSMPVLYKGQTHIESHNWTRTNAGLFDVSHMLQSKLSGPHSIKFLQRVTPTDFNALPIGHGTLSVLLNPEGGVVDDTIVTKENQDNEFYIVTNAGCAKRDTESFVESCKTILHWTVNGKSLKADLFWLYKAPRLKMSWNRYWKKRHRAKL